LLKENLPFIEVSSDSLELSKEELDLVRKTGVIWIKGK
jgi:hypothetical protein